MKTYFAFFPVLLAACALGQASPDPKGKAAPPTPPAGITVSEPAFLFPVEERIKIRDLQVEYDDLEIENQKILLKVEQNRQRQAVIMDGIKMDAYQFAQTKHINLEAYQLNTKDITFEKKRAK